MSIDITNGQRRWLDLAKRVALQSEYKHRVGAVLVRGGQVINTACNSSGYNRWASTLAHHSNKQPEHASLHAELRCMLNLSISQTNGGVVYVVRLAKDELNSLTMAKPCPMCEASMRLMRIKKVYYSDSHGDLQLLKL